MTTCDRINETSNQLKPILFKCQRQLFHHLPSLTEAVLDERLKVIEIIQITQISNPFSIFNCVVAVADSKPLISDPENEASVGGGGIALCNCKFRQTHFAFANKKERSQITEGIATA